jgi:hypothetical protein
MKIQGIRREATPGLSGALSGASQGVQGYLQGVALTQAQQQRERELALREQDAARRQAMLDLSIGRTSQAYDRQRFMQGQALRKEDTERQEKGAAQRSGASILDAARARITSGMPQPKGPYGDTVPGAQSGLPPEIEAAFEQIRNDPNLSPEERADAIESWSALASAGARDSAAKELATRIQQEVASGRWTPEAGLGLQIDIDGDGKPDDWSDAPNKLLFLLGEGKLDPMEVAQLHENAKRAGTQQQAMMKRRMMKVAEAQTRVETNAALMPPEAQYAADEVIARYQDGEFGSDQFGEQEFERELGAAMQGMVFVEGKNGRRYAVPYAEAAQAELDLKAPPKDPALQNAEDFAGLADRFFPPFTPPKGTDGAAVSDAEIKAAQDRHMADKLTFLDAFLKRFGIVNPGDAKNSEADRATRAEEYGKNLTRGVKIHAGEPALPGPPSKKTVEHTPEQAAAVSDETFASTLTGQIRTKYDAMPPEEQAKFRQMVRERRGR